VRFPSQQQPSRSIEEVIEKRGFTRKIEDVREADFRLANHRLQPLGHLTAAVFLSIRQRAGYASRDLVLIVPEIVPVIGAIDRVGKPRLHEFAPPAEGSGSFGNETSCELSEWLKVARLGQRPLLRRPAPRGDWHAAAGVRAARIRVHRFSEPLTTPSGFLGPTLLLNKPPEPRGLNQI
jgi:hypothetical protein